MDPEDYFPQEETDSSVSYKTGKVPCRTEAIPAEGYCKTQMNILEKININHKRLRETRNPLAASLGTLKGEIDKSGTGSVSDEEAIKVVKKFVLNIDELIKYATPTTKQELEKERAMYEAYLPKQLSEAEILTIIANEATIDPNFKTVPNIMKFFKAKYPGLYDGKLLSDIAKR